MYIAPANRLQGHLYAANAVALACACAHELIDLSSRNASFTPLQGEEK
jgi:hypothetical protein